MKKEELNHYITKNSEEFFRHFFCDFPDDLYPYLQIRTFTSREILISSTQASPNVFFLLKGTLLALEDRIQNQPYIFTKLHPIDIVGDYEIFSHTNFSYATIYSSGTSECLTLPSGLYRSWISNCSAALYYRTCLLMRQLGKQTIRDRQFFFMDYITRCISIILDCSFSDEGTGLSLVSYTREELAGQIGCSLRTCHRIIQQLATLKYITIFHGKIAVTNEQKIKLRKLFDQKLQNL